MLNGNFVIGDLPNDVLRDIYRYWLDIKGKRRMPSSGDINPDDIVRLLPYISYIDVEKSPCRYKMRQIGAQTIKAMTIDVTGKYLDEYPFVEGTLKKNYDWLVEKKRPYLNFDKLKWSSKSFLEYFALGLPLSSDDKNVDMLMFGMYYQFPKDIRTKFYSL